MSPSSQSGSVWCCPALALLCCRRSPMGAGLSQTQDGAVASCGSSYLAQGSCAPPTMAEAVRERKRKVNGGLATLRRRLMAGRRGRCCSRAQDRAGPLRDLLKEWSPLEVGALLEEYEALAALRDLCVQAELARPPAAALRGDLAALYDQRICPDAELVYKGACFPVHRAVLSARCPYFRDLLNGYPSWNPRVCLEAPLPPQVDSAALDGLLRYLYCGEPTPAPQDGDSGEVSRRRPAASVPDCCPNQTDVHQTQYGVGGRLALDVVGGGGGGGGSCGRRPDPALLRRLAEDLGGNPASLHRDMRRLLDTAEYADASLVFTSEPPPVCPPSAPAPSQQQQQPVRAGSPPSCEGGFRPRLELPCHRAVLSARSPFFRSVIQRRCRQQQSLSESSGAVKIVLDERVIPHKYARVLLHAVYTDQVDLNLIMRNGGSIFGCSLLGNHSSSLGEAQVLSSSQQGGSGASRSGAPGTAPHTPSPLEEAMELYEIGRFLELDILSQGCEDIIAERLSATTLAAVLKWSTQPHGSKWVHRQALRFLCEEFQTVAMGPALPQLEACHLAHALRCPFLQASELDALRAVLRWGEHKLIKRMEDREPNLLSHTAHSVTRKGVKKRDLSDTELRELLADILPLVRIDHILPPNSELLNQAIRRGLVSSPPSCMLGDEASGGSRADAWIRGKGHGGLYVRPRLYMPYYEEVKALLEDQSVQETELVRMRRARYIPDIPDTLYMVSAEPRVRTSARSSRASGGSVCGGSGGAGSAGAAGARPQGGAASPAWLRSAVLARQRELSRAPAQLRAASLPRAHTHEISRQIRLRVVREFNLPDSVADTLEQPLPEAGSRASNEEQTLEPAQHQHMGDNSRSGLDDDDTDMETDELGSRRCLQNSSDAVDDWRAQHDPNDHSRSHPGDSARQRHRHASSQVATLHQPPAQALGRGLSEAMPDVAMATSSLSRLRLTQEQLPGQPPGGGEAVEARGRYSLCEGETSQCRYGAACDAPEDKPSQGFNSVSREICTYSLSRNNSREMLREYPSSSSNNADNFHSYSRSEAQHLENTRSTLSRNNSKEMLREGYAEGCRGAAGCEEVGRRGEGGAVAFMNPNQHLLQEGCLGGYSNTKRHPRTQTWNTEASPFQPWGEAEGAPPLQLDLGDGNRHSSPNRLPAGSQSSWSHSRAKVSGSTPGSSDYTQTQQYGSCPPEGPGRQPPTNYSQYLSTCGVTMPSNCPSPHDYLQGFSTLQHPPSRGRVSRGCSGGSSTLQRQRGPSPSPSASPSAPQSLSHALDNLNTCKSLHSSQNNAPPGYKSNAQLCPGVAMKNKAGQSCGVNVNSQSNRQANVKSAQNAKLYTPSKLCAEAWAGGLQREPPGVQRSHSAGSVSSAGSCSSIANEIDNKAARDNKQVQNVSGFNHPPPGYSSDKCVGRGEGVEARTAAYQLGASLIHQQSHFLLAPEERAFLPRSQPQSIPYYPQRPGSCGLPDSPLYPSISNSRGNSPFRTLESGNSQFSRGNSPYSSRMESGSNSSLLRVAASSNQQMLEQYCQYGTREQQQQAALLQRSSSPRYDRQKSISSSPSNIKMQRNLSSSPSFSNFSNVSGYNNLKMQGSTRNVTNSPGSSMLLSSSPGNTMSLSNNSPRNSMILSSSPGNSMTLSSSPRNSMILSNSPGNSPVVANYPGISKQSGGSLKSYQKSRGNNHNYSNPAVSVHGPSKSSQPSSASSTPPNFQGKPGESSKDGKSSMRAGNFPSNPQAQQHNPRFL